MAQEEVHSVPQRGKTQVWMTPRNSCRAASNYRKHAYLASKWQGSSHGICMLLWQHKTMCLLLESVQVPSEAWIPLKYYFFPLGHCKWMTCGNHHTRSRSFTGIIGVGPWLSGPASHRFSLWLKGKSSRWQARPTILENQCGNKKYWTW